MVLVLMVCAGVPAGWLGWTLLSQTIEAGKGAECPACAVDEYFATGPLDAFGGDDLAVANVLCSANKTKLRAGLREMAAALSTAEAKWNVSVRFEPGASDGDSPDEMADRKVSLTVPVHTIHEKLGGIVVSSYTHTWRFEVVDEDGWRICAVEHPDVCAEIIKCEGPPATPSATPSPSTEPSPSPSPQPTWKVWDDRVSWWCSDAAGALKKRNCPAPPADWVQPGPWECAPEYPFRTPPTVTWCREQGWNV